MASVPGLRGRSREVAVLAAGLCAAGALLWAGATVHEGLATAGEVAVARLSSAVEETVKAEWRRMLSASEPPVKPAGEVFRWNPGDQLLVPIDAQEPAEDEEQPEEASDASRSVVATLLAEAERRELVEHDDSGALELVLESLDKEPDAEQRPAAQLRALQLGVRLGRLKVAAEQWKELRRISLEQGTQIGEGWVPYRLLAWFALPASLRGQVQTERLPTPDELERLYARGDRLVLGSAEDPAARFEPSPLLLVTCERMGCPLPPLERRKVLALSMKRPLPEALDDGSWHLVRVGRVANGDVLLPFVLRRVRDEISGSFYAPSELQAALAEHSRLPAGFHLDFTGDREDEGPAVRPRTDLPDSELAFTLRHEDPASLGQAEASRLKLLRGALFALALACAGGGVLTARLLARQRKLDALKSAFIAGVSHDLRTPLASILLLTENLESGAAGADPARTHRALRKEATRLRRLVDDVLDFSRLERGQATRIERENVALAPFLAELEAEFRARVEAAGRAFALERGELPPSAAFDAHAVRRALENLLDNALKHGRGTVKLACAAADGRLSFRVSDDGPGVPASERERAFEPFERLAATNGHVGGTGLGLAIVRAIARGHGGEARIADGAGAGSVFELDLPLLAEGIEEERG